MAPCSAEPRAVKCQAPDLEKSCSLGEGSASDQDVAVGVGIQEVMASSSSSSSSIGGRSEDAAAGTIVLYTGPRTVESYLRSLGAGPEHSPSAVAGLVMEAMNRKLEIPKALQCMPIVDEPLLGPGIPLPDCRVGVPRLHLLTPAQPHASGTVLFVHGSCAVDHLGNKSEDGEPLLGGITELAMKFQEEGFVSAVLNSYADGRRDEINANGGTINRVDDIMSALQFAKDQNLPEPVHVYGKSNGGYALSMFLEMPQMDDKTITEEKKSKATELLQTVDSCIIQCPFLSQKRDVPRLEAVANDSSVELPPTLFLLAEQDKMLSNFNQPTLVGVEAANAMVGGSLEEVKVEEVVCPNTEEVASQCTVLRGSMEVEGGVPRETEVRVYSDIGHTFVCDAEHEPITDGSNVPIVEHAAEATVQWCHGRRHKAAARALHLKLKDLKKCGRAAAAHGCRRGSKEACGGVRRGSKEKACASHSVRQSSKQQVRS